MQIFGIWCLHRSVNLAFVETFWIHNVTWKLWCFSALERGDFSLLYSLRLR